MGSIKKKKTKYAAVVALGISGAFDKIKWMHIIRNVVKTGAQGCYTRAIRQLVTKRRVQYRFVNGQMGREATMGCPQGGRASPGL